MFDSTLPPEISTILHEPELTDRALEILFKECEFNRECRSLKPDFKKRIFTLLSRLKENPVNITIKLSDNIKKVILLDDRDLFGIIFLSLYDWRLRMDLPRQLSDAFEGRYNELKVPIKYWVELQLSESISDGLSLSISCSEMKKTLSKRDFMKKVNEYPRVARYTKEGWEYLLCDIWPNYKLEKIRYEPVISDVPILFLAGEIDPVTPPEWAISSSKGYKNSYVYSFPRAGHSVINNTLCGAQVVKKFFSNPKQDPYVECK